MKLIILVLGSPNDEKGVLSKIALDRLEYAFSIYANNNNACFLCTGGFGEHFNTTSFPHAHYAKQFLINKGARESDFLEFVVSSNTVEDFKISKPIIERERPDLLVVVTSDFHMERAKILCGIALNYHQTIFIPSKSSLTNEELIPLLLHENNAIKKIKDNSYVLY